jgi:hypothetical protein
MCWASLSYITGPSIHTSTNQNSYLQLHGQCQNKKKNPIWIRHTSWPLWMIEEAVKETRAIQRIIPMVTMEVVLNYFAIVVGGSTSNMIFVHVRTGQRISLHCHDSQMYRGKKYIQKDMIASIQPISPSPCPNPWTSWTAPSTLAPTKNMLRRCYQPTWPCPCGLMRPTWIWQWLCSLCLVSLGLA